MSSKVCYLCDSKLRGHRPPVQVCSSVIKSSETLFIDKVSEMLGDDYVLIVTPNDYTCDRCLSVVTYFEMIERELQIIKDAFMYLIMKKYEILPADSTFEAIGIVDQGCDAQKQKDQGSSNSSASKSYPNLFKSESYKKKLYKCCYCPFMSQVLFIMDSHLKDHVKKKKKKKRSKRAPTKKVKIAKSYFMCKLCSLKCNTKKQFDSHVGEVHNHKENKNEVKGATSLAPKDLQEKKLEQKNVKQKKPAQVLQSSVSDSFVPVENLGADGAPMDITEFDDIVPIGDQNISQSDIDTLIASFCNKLDDITASLPS